ncbi:MAG: hypothetical protein ACRC2X_09885, partial [Giesbergeria sp.]
GCHAAPTILVAGNWPGSALALPSCLSVSKKAVWHGLGPVMLDAPQTKTPTDEWAFFTAGPHLIGCARRI